ncbi:MAG: aminomethyl-transferring glycine dehydrogenase subunit GcvPA [Anaerolineae bacterium]|nr:aminomethyl-transferring glycine dehydrogenase subunit GcvPA [Anaerolineae bacterium]
MNYIPNTDADRALMLEVVGAKSTAELFRDVPEPHRFPALDLPPALSEMEVLDELNALANENDDLQNLACFLGAGAYCHFVPSVVDFILHRSEFFTAYTPYQPEISQGTLQAHYEYQSMICALTGMEVSNVSHYDGATAVAEAVIMALQVGRGKRNKVILSPTLNPQYREVVRTYTQGMSLDLAGDDALADLLTEPTGARSETGPSALLDALAALLDKQTACVIVQNPDFLGRLYTPAEMQALADKTHAAGAQLVVSVDPISLGLFVPPGQYGADVVTGEGQPMGNGISFGGPYLGFFAMKSADVRRSAGRIVGQTVDADGKRGYVLTLSTREQHIRREKASSNICTNQALNALAAAIYMAAMGKYGLRTVAELSYHKAHYAADLIGKLSGYDVVSRGPFFKEFVVRCPRPVAFINENLLDRYGMIGGYDLGGDYPGLKDHMLVCVTEMNSRMQIELLAEALGEIAGMNPDRYDGDEEVASV